MNQDHVRSYVAIEVMRQSSAQLRRIVSVNFIGVARFDVNVASDELKNIFANEMSRSDQRSNVGDDQFSLNFLSLSLSLSFPIVRYERVTVELL